MKSARFPKNQQHNILNTVQYKDKERNIILITLLVSTHRH